MDPQVRSFWIGATWLVVLVMTVSALSLTLFWIDQYMSFDHVHNHTHPAHEHSHKHAAHLHPHPWPEHDHRHIHLISKDGDAPQ